MEYESALNKMICDAYNNIRLLPFIITLPIQTNNLSYVHIFRIVHKLQFGIMREKINRQQWNVVLSFNICNPQATAR